MGPSRRSLAGANSLAHARIRVGLDGNVPDPRDRRAPPSSTLRPQKKDADRMQDRAQFPTRAGEKRIGGKLTEQQSEESNCQRCDNRHAH